MDRSRGILFAAFILLAALASQAAAAEAAAPTVEQALAPVPDSAFLVVVVDSAREAEDSLATFIDTISPGMGQQVRDGFYEGLGNIAGASVGAEGSVNDAAPVVFAVVVTAEEPEPLLLLPVTDYQAWRQTRAEEIATDEETGREYVTGRYGKKSFFKEIGGYVALSETPAALDTVGQGSPLSAGRASGLAERLSKGFVAVNFSMPALLAAYPDLFDKLEARIRSAGEETGRARSEADEELDSTGEAGEMSEEEKEEAAPAEPSEPSTAPGDGVPEQTKAALLMYVELLRELSRGLDQVYAAAVAGAEGAEISARVTTLPVSLLRTVFNEQGPVDAANIALLPADPMAMMAFGLRGEATWSLIAKVYGDFAALAATDPAKAESVRTALMQAIAAVRQYKLTDNVAMGVYVGAPGSLFEQAVVYTAPQAEEARKAMLDILSNPDVNLMMMKGFAAGGIEGGAPEITTEQIDGTDVTVYRQPLTFPESEPMAAEMFRNMFGEAIVVRMAAKDGRLYATTGQSDSRMKTLLSPAGQGRVDMDKVTRSMAQVGDGLSGVGLISAPGYIKLVLSMIPMGMMSQGPVEEPAADIYGAFGYGFADGAADVKFVMPMSQILAAKQMIETIMGGMGGPGMYEGGEDMGGTQYGPRTSNLKEIGLAIGMYQFGHDEAMPQNLQALVAGEYVPGVETFAAPGSGNESVDPADVDASGDYYYARLKDSKTLADPSSVPIAWEKKVAPGGRLPVLFANLSVREIPPAELQAMLQAGSALYSQTPPLPAETPGYPAAGETFNMLPEEPQAE